MNTSPTCIVLDAPYTTGDLNPDARYPHVYIVSLYLNGPMLSMSITYEFGEMREQWYPAPLVPAVTLQLNGAQLIPFFSTEASTDGSMYLWDQVESLMYEQIQATNARCAGRIGSIGAPVVPDAPIPT